MIVTFLNPTTKSSNFILMLALLFSDSQSKEKMASPTARITFRVVMLTLALLVLFYMGRPLYWKISATIHEIRENRQTVKQGLSQIVLEAQRTVGWYQDESDSGVREDRVGKKLATTRRLLFNQVS